MASRTKKIVREEEAVSARGVAEKGRETRMEDSGPEQDLEDIRRSLNGDGDAYADLISCHQARVASRMWRFTRNREDHEELVQEVFVQAYLSLATFRGEAPFAHWLARISTRVGYSFLKKVSRQRLTYSIPVEDLDQLVAREPHEMDPEWAAELLHRLMGKLPPRDRLVLDLRYMEHHSVAETAQLTGWTQSMVKVQAWRARKKLRKLLQETGVEF